MYNHYIGKETTFSRIPDTEPKHDYGAAGEKRENGFFSFFTKEKDEKNAGLSGILKRLKLDDIDTGDILLFLILIFIVLEGDNWELALVLGLVLFLSLRGDDPV